MARKRATEAGVADRVNFDVATAQDFPGERYDLVCVLDALHDMGDPPAAARHIRHNLDTDGTWLLVEPMAGDSLEANVNPVGRIFYAGSTFICTPGAQAQAGDYALGNQVPDAHLAELIDDAGFSRFRRATETPFNRVFEARPSSPLRSIGIRPLVLAFASKRRGPYSAIGRRELSLASSRWTEWAGAELP